MQKINQKKIAVNKRLMLGLKPFRVRVYLAHSAALVLGIVAAILGIVIGPAIQILLMPNRRDLLWADVVGPVWSNWLSFALHSDGISIGDLYKYLPVVLVVVASVKAVLAITQWYTWEWIGERLAFDLRQKLVTSFIKLNPVSRDRDSVVVVERELGGLMTQDIRTCRDYIVHFFGGLPREGLQAIFLAISVAALSPRLFLVFAVCLAPIVMLLSRVGRKIKKRTTRALEDNSMLGEWIQQRLMGIETIKQFGTEAFESQAMQVASGKLFEGFLSAVRVKSRTGPMIEVMGILAMCTAIGVAFFEITKGHLSGAVAMSFFASLALFAQTATKLGRYFNSNREGLAAAERIFNALDAFTSNEQSVVRPNNILERSDQTAIALDNVRINYGKKRAVDNVSKTFLAGKLYCVVGASGAGKSTLISAILGLRNIEDGSIKYRILDDLQDRLDICYMPQSVPTFPGTIAENVAYPHLSFDINRIRSSLLAVGFPLASSRIENDLERIVGPGHLQLSGGESQRLQLARLVYHRAPFILIDEGTSALDPELEKQVLKEARELARSGSVVIMIAHRPTAVEFADEILIMREGRVVSVGPYSEVISSPEFKAIFG